MEKIKNYLNYIFSDYSNTRKIEEIKTELLDNLTDRVRDYQNDGYDEKEAINKAIESLGDIDELLESFNIKPSPQQYSDDLNDYIAKIKETNEIFKATKKKMALKIAFGVFLIIQAIAISTLFDFFSAQTIFEMFSSSRNSYADAYFFLNVGIAVVLFILAGFDTTKYELKTPYSAEEIVEFEADRKVKDLKFKLREEATNEGSKYNTMLVVGIALCIFALLPTMLIPDSNLGDFAFLLIVAFAVGLIIYSGINRGLMPNLVEYQATEEDKKIGRFSSVVMILAVIIFLVSGLIFNLWHPAWIVFPVFALGIGIYSTIVSK